MNYDANNELRVQQVGNDHYVEDSVLWYIFPFEEAFYLTLDIHQRINYKNNIIYGDYDQKNSYKL